MSSDVGYSWLTRAIPTSSSSSRPCSAASDPWRWRDHPASKCADSGGRRYLPGCLYLHDLAILGGRLLANAVALNAVVELPEAGGFRPVWWPRSIDGACGPLFGRNYLQLNSIAAGDVSRTASSPPPLPRLRRAGRDT